MIKKKIMYIKKEFLDYITLWKLYRGNKNDFVLCEGEFKIDFTYPNFYFEIPLDQQNQSIAAQ